MESLQRTGDKAACARMPTPSLRLALRGGRFPTPRPSQRYPRSITLALQRQQWIFINDSLADPVQKRLAHYFESGERRNWASADFIVYLDTLYADDTTVGEARLQLLRLRQRANEPFTEFLVSSAGVRQAKRRYPQRQLCGGRRRLQGRGGQGPGLGPSRRSPPPFPHILGHPLCPHFFRKGVPNFLA
ncbi:hypothetical protein E4U16_008065 [Claviceps sp. LM84 group G4]|nr:hypothetical protein E4U16_008065 [Claviceps sp. LM84 group G4]